VGTDTAFTALLYPSDDTAVSRAIPTIDLALRALQIARNAASEGLYELTAARDTLPEKYATLQQECLDLKASLTSERELRQAEQRTQQATVKGFAHDLVIREERRTFAEAIRKERQELVESFENETAARRTVLEAICVERAQLERTLREERAARKVEQETARFGRAEAERLLHQEHTARRAVLEAICLERAKLEATLDREQFARKQDQEASRLERTEANHLQQRLRMEMAQIARERDLLASRLDDALHTSMLSAPIPLHGPSTAQPSEYPTLCAIPILYVTSRSRTHCRQARSEDYCRENGRICRS
jgi:hypothetical protein